MERYQRVRNRKGSGTRKEIGLRERESGMNWESGGCVIRKVKVKGKKVWSKKGIEEMD
jgi:hypothetical protein